MTQDSKLTVSLQHNQPLEFRLGGENNYLSVCYAHHKGMMMMVLVLIGEKRKQLRAQAGTQRGMENGLCYPAQSEVIGHDFQHKYVPIYSIDKGI